MNTIQLTFLLVRYGWLFYLAAFFMLSLRIMGYDRALYSVGIIGEEDRVVTRTLLVLGWLAAIALSGLLYGWWAALFPQVFIG